MIVITPGRQNAVAQNISKGKCRSFQVTVSSTKIILNSVINPILF